MNAPLTKAQLEIAAREACRLTDADPDQREMDWGGSKPIWQFWAEELERQDIIALALAVGRNT